MPALGGPSSTVFHSCSVKSVFPVIGLPPPSRRPRPRLPPRSRSFASGATLRADAGRLITRFGRYGNSTLSWALVWVALTVLGVAAVSRRLTGTPVTPAMVFMVVGVLAGPEVADGITASPTQGTVRTLAEATLTVVLFSDAARVKLGALRREYAVPVRLLGIGLPLTIALGWLLADALFGAFTATEALVVA